jgi:hypothetical protein
MKTGQTIRLANMLRMRAHLFIMALIQIINKLSNIPNGLFLNSLETELLGGEYSEKEKRVLVDKISAL